MGAVGTLTSMPMLLGTTCLQPGPPTEPTLMSQVAGYLVVVVAGTPRVAYVDPKKDLPDSHSLHSQ